MVRYRIVHDNDCLCENLSDIEVYDLLLLYKEKYPDWELETQKYNFDPGGPHLGRDPDLH